MGDTSSSRIDMLLILWPQVSLISIYCDTILDMGEIAKENVSSRCTQKLDVGETAKQKAERSSSRCTHTYIARDVRYRITIPRYSIECRY